MAELSFLDLQTASQSVQELVKELENLDRAYGTLNNSLKKDANEIINSIQGLTGAEKNYVQMMDEAVAKTAEIKKASEGLKGAYQAVKTEALDLVSKQTAQKMSVESLKLEYQHVTKLLSQFSMEERTSSKEAIELNRNLKMLQNTMNEGKGLRGTVAGLGGETKKLRRAFGALAPSFTIVTDLFGKGNSVLRLLIGSFGSLASLLNPVTLAITALSAGAYALYNALTAQSDAVKNTNEVLKEMGKIAAEPITQFTMMQEAWNQLGDSLHDKEKYVRDNQEAFNALGVSVKNVHQAEDFLVANASNFIRSIMLKARAQAEYAKVVELTTRELELQHKVEQATAKRQTSGAFMYWVYGLKANKAQKDLTKTLSEKNRIVKAAVQHEGEYAKLIKQSHFSTVKHTSAINHSTKSTKLARSATKDYTDELIRLKKAQEELSVSLMKEGMDKEIAEIRLKNKYLLQEYRANAKGNIEVEKEKANLRALIIKSEEEQISQIKEEYAKKESDRQKKADEEAQKRFEKERARIQKLIEEEQKREKAARKAMLATFYDESMKLAEQYFNQQKEFADKELESAKSVLEEKEAGLQREIDLRNKGLANNVEAYQKEVQAARENLQQKQALENQATKNQMILQSIQQAANLITAISKIWAEWGAMPWVAGAMIAAMIASFIASQSMAYNAVKEGQKKQTQLGAGHVELIKGGSHASGKDTFIGRYNGVNYKAEKGEYFAVVNRRNSAKYGELVPDIINALNAGTFEKQFAPASSVDVSPITKNLADIHTTIKNKNERQIIIDNKGNKIIMYKNVTRKIYA